MKRTLVICGLFLTLGAQARAGLYQMTYYDLIRPHGHPRSYAIYQANLDFCYRRTGANMAFPDTPAFKACMRGRGYRWLSTRTAPIPHVDWAQESINEQTNRREEELLEKRNEDSSNDHERQMDAEHAGGQ